MSRSAISESPKLLSRLEAAPGCCGPSLEWVIMEVQKNDTLNCRHDFEFRLVLMDAKLDVEIQSRELYCEKMTEDDAEKTRKALEATWQDFANDFFAYKVTKVKLR